MAQAGRQKGEAALIPALAGGATVHDAANAGAPSSWAEGEGFEPPGLAHSGFQDRKLTFAYVCRSPCSPSRRHDLSVTVGGGLS